MINIYKSYLIIPLTILSLFVVPAFVLASGDWLIYYKPEFKGKVLDAETKEPIEGAVVVAVYDKIVIRWAPESFSVIKNIKETLTLKDGTFSIPAYLSLTDPLSFDFGVTFIIFKPGYGRFPGYQITPSGIKPIDQEVFFSKEVGSKGELRMWVKEDIGPRLRKSKVVFGIVELPKLKTRDERRRNIPSLPSWDELLKKQKNLIRLINEEEENIGLQKSDPFKALKRRRE